MNKRIRLIKINGEVEDMRTTFDYTVGETIAVNDRNNLYKCVEIIKEDDVIIHCFKQGKRFYSFDW